MSQTSEKLAFSICRLVWGGIIYFTGVFYMKKKLFVSALIFIVLALCSMCLFACSTKNDEHTHGWSKWAADNGITHTRTCECGESETKNHNWNNGLIIKEATCKESGLKNYTCLDCGQTKTESIEKTNSHNFGVWTKNDSLSHSRTCPVCNKTENANHSWDNGTVTKSPNCKETGVKTYTCSDCGATKTETIEKTSVHTWGKWTSDNAETHSHICTVCSESETENHSMTNETCTVCGFSYIPATITAVDNATMDYANSSIEMLVDKNTSSVNLSNMVKVSPNSSWKLYGADSSLIPTKYANLQDGDNDYLIVVSSADGLYDNTYSLNIYKSFEVSVKFYDVYNSVVRTVTADTGCKYTIDYTPEIVGYTFNYWKLGDKQTTEFTPYDDVNLYSDCTANTYFLNLNADGGEVAENSTQVTFDSNYTLPVPTKTGHTFTGWYYRENKITDIDGTSLKTSKFSEISEIIAKWQINSYRLNVEYDDYNHGSVVGSGDYDYASSVTVEATTKAGYTFVGWYNGETLLDSNLTYTFTMPAESVTYTAKWCVATEMFNFNFTVSESDFIITGIKDNTVTSIVIPNYVTVIGDNAFSNCYDLNEITIPDSVITIGNSAFSGSAHFVDVYYTGNISKWCKIKFKNSYSNPLLMTSNFYIDKEIVNEIKIPDDVTEINERAFIGYVGLKNITIPDSVTKIGVAAFYRSGLTSIALPNKCEKIEDYTFAGCQNLEIVNIGDSVNSIGNNAFDGCLKLSSVNMPNCINSIGDYAFRSCHSLKSITIPSNLKTIGIKAFWNCTLIEQVNITDIKSWCNVGFADLYSNPLAYGDLFIDGELTKEIIIPNEVTKINTYSFNCCSGLQSIYIPQSVTFIDSYAFLLCSGLTIYCETGEKPIDWKSNWNALREYGNIYSYCPVIWDYKNNNLNGAGGTYQYIDGIRYKLIGENAVVLTQPTTLKGEVNIPEIINYEDKSYSVTNIVQDAFRDCDKITGITLPISINYVGDNVFSGCTGLTYAKIPFSAVKELPTQLEEIVLTSGSLLNGEFSGFSKLKRISLPNSITKIGDSSFYNCISLTSINIPNGVTEIGDFAFRGCSLTGISLSNGVLSVGDAAFSDCGSLVSLHLPASIKRIGTYIISGCSNLTEIVVDDGNTVYRSFDNNCIIEIETKTLICGLSNCKIPNNNDVAIIGAGAFLDNHTLTNISIPNNIISIGDFAFSGCTSLSTINISESVKSIGERAFSDCNINSVNYMGETADWCNIQFTDMDSNPIKFANKFKINNSVIENLIIPGSATKISEYAFYEFKGLVSVKVASGVTKIGHHAFSGCVKLDSVDIAGSVTEIEDFAFLCCYNLKSVTFSTGLKRIGDRVFESCVSLTNLKIPESVTYIGNCVLSGCDKLQYNEYNNGLYLGNETNKCVVLIKVNNIDITICEINKNTKLIYNSAFSGCSKLTSITIPDNATHIGTYAFNGCSSLSSITIPNSVTQIGDSVFSGCSGLTSINVGENNTIYSSQDGILYNKAKTEFIYIPAALKGDITIPDGVTSISDSAFSGCSGLTSITIPDSVTDIGNSAFVGCSQLTIYCEAASKPNGWDSNWNNSNCPVVWDYKNKS